MVPWPEIDRAMPASPQNSSSRVRGRVRPVLSFMLAWAKKSNEYRPIWAASWTMGQGNSSRSSHSSPAGRMTVSAKSWTHFWICCWSSLSWRENWLIAVAPLVAGGASRVMTSYPSVTSS
jgi:hypothetical protein